MLLSVLRPHSIRRASQVERHRRGIALVVLAIGLSTARCRDSQSPAPRVSPRETMVQGVAGIWTTEETQRHLLARIAQGIALSLADAELRLLVRDALRDSPFREHKVHLRSFLSGPGRQLLGKMSTVGGGVSETEMLATVDSAIDLELYIPVPAHFEAWRGDASLLVATAFRDRELPLAFDLRGNHVPLASAMVPPTVPTLAVVPREADFTFHEVASTMSAMPPTQTAVMTYSFIPGTWEGWLMGSPEFETHVFVRDTADYAAVSYRCAGATRPSPYYYDQNLSYWQGQVQLLSSDDWSHSMIRASS